MASVGKYEIIKELGRGGFGTVYEAKDTVLGRHVALKVLHGQLTVDPSFILRFEQEARLAAQLEHPNLVPVYDFGQASGYNFIAMGLMRGGSLKDLIATEGALDQTTIRKILPELLESLRVIHENNIIHRDLKPANILFDQYGVARLSDLGFAKAMQSEDSRSYSQSGGMVGTAAYMAPEIWRGAEASQLSDIYSLGCIIYEMLRGKVLFDGITPAESMTKHLIDRPQIDFEIPTNWQALITGCLAKEPEDRFSSVDVVLDYFQNQLVEPLIEPSVDQKTQATTIVSQEPEEIRQPDPPVVIEEKPLSEIGVPDESAVDEVTIQENEPLDDTPDVENDYSVKEEGIVSESEPVLDGLKPEAKKKTGLLKFIIPASILIVAFVAILLTRNTTKQSTYSPSTSTPVVAETQRIENTVAVVVEKTKTPVPTDTPTATPTFEISEAPFLSTHPDAISLANANGLTELLKFTYHTGTVQSAAWSPDNSLVASSGEEQVIRIWNAETGEQVHLLGGHQKAVNSLSWSPDGQKLASGSWDGTVIVWDVASEEKLLVLTAHTDMVSSIAWSPDGQRLASASSDRTVRIWHSETGDVLLVLEKHDDIVSSVAWSPDGKRLVSGSFDGKMRLWDTNNGDLVSEADLQKGYVICLDWSPNGKQIAIGTFFGVVLVWDVETGKIVRTLDKHTSYVVSVSWTPDNKLIASGSADKSIRIWDLATGRQIKVIEIHTHSVLGVRWSSDGKKLLSASEDETARIWGLP